MRVLIFAFGLFATIAFAQLSSEAAAQAINPADPKWTRPLPRLSDKEMKSLDPRKAGVGTGDDLAEPEKSEPEEWAAEERNK